METKTSFTLVNHSKDEIIIIHEPEAVEFLLPAKEKIEVVVQESCINAIAVNCDIFEGKVCISIWGDNSEYLVLYNGENAFGKYGLD